MENTTVGSLGQGVAFPLAMSYSSTTWFFFASKSRSVEAFQVFTA